MLVLTRRVDEVLRIGHDVSIRVLAINGGQVRFGIDAPKDISIHREEIYFKILREKEKETELQTL